ncbi:MAG: GIY-YIG nuclease family protein [Bacteroidales bacterium]|nr:GIY-YIG nuclease family protein [Bacteroidales bacterium]
MANKHNTTLYTGVTNDLKRRTTEHKLHINKSFTDRYNIEKFVCFETCEDMTTAIHREKQLKKWKGNGKRLW